MLAHFAWNKPIRCLPSTETNIIGLPHEGTGPHIPTCWRADGVDNQIHVIRNAISYSELPGKYAGSELLAKLLINRSECVGIWH